MTKPIYTIIVNAPEIPDDELVKLVEAAATRLAETVDDGVAPFDVDVIEGTPAEPLSGDNVHGLGRKPTT
jgi:hypothetical protein